MTEEQKQLAIDIAEDFYEKRKKNGQEFDIMKMRVKKKSEALFIIEQYVNTNPTSFHPSIAVWEWVSVAETDQENLAQRFVRAACNHFKQLKTDEIVFQLEA